MSTAQTWQTESSSLEDTLNLAEQIGQRLKGGEVIELVSDLGGGKTAFARGLAKGIGSADKVHSPSFTISNEYKADRLTMHHLDFYRLNSAGIMSDELAEIINDPNNVVVVEWAEIVEDILPVEHLTIKLIPTGDTTRKIIFENPDELSYLLPKNT